MAGADTVERSSSPSEYARTWYKQNPPLPKAKWSQRNNNNYSADRPADGAVVFHRQQQALPEELLPEEQSGRSTKPKNEGPAAYVFPADDPRPGAQAELLRMLPGAGGARFRAPRRRSRSRCRRRRHRVRGRRAAGGGGRNGRASAKPERAKADETPTTETQQFPAGSYIVRMDQPYSRIADTLLDYQYWAPNDPQTRPYDDTGWTFGELFNVQVVRVTDPKVLDAAMERVTDECARRGRIDGSGSLYADQPRRGPVAR